ncbi:MAG: hypothetical protein ACREYC_23150 [Gammaproteobacteria bacterium]
MPIGQIGSDKSGSGDRIYFVQGIGEPTEGLIAQPVRSLLDSWGHSATEIGDFALLVSLPWVIKPLYGPL